LRPKRFTVRSIQHWIRTRRLKLAVSAMIRRMKIRFSYAAIPATNGFIMDATRFL